MKPSCEWKLYADRAMSPNGFGAGLMLVDPKGKEYIYALHFGFKTSNNKAEYKSIIGHVTNIPRDGNYKLGNFRRFGVEVLVEVLSKRSIEEKEILQVETKEGEIWMTHIHEYLVSGLLSEDPKESRRIRVKEPQYKLLRRSLYRRSFYTPWLRCVASPQTDDIIIYTKVTVVSTQNHDQWWLKSQSKVAIEHSMKWVEAKPLASISGMNAERHVWEYHTEIINHIEKKWDRIQQGLVDDIAQVLWVHRTLLRNSQKETPFILTYGSEAMILISKNNVAKDDMERIKEVNKRR
uniref:Reverse transcriptase domain-containing protein n=1 Tax=Tanacetum cinerariifolium TaxID=118510 RepID=A0A699GHB0_TANCI|nr:hypothetical protein [Tanacetum cinerariifolium]